MALEYAHGAIQWLAADVATTTYTVSGLAFQPKALRFFCVGHQSATDAATATVDLRMSVGFAVSTSSRRCVAIFDDDGAASMDCGAGLRDDCVIATIIGAGTFDGMLDLNAINSDGFSLIVDDAAPVNITVFWEAWGGSDITVAALVDIAEPAATGNQSYTATGFTSDGANQVVMFAGCQSTAAANTGAAADAGLCIGYATGTGATAQIVAAINQDDGSNTADTDGYALSSECLAMIALAGGNPNARAAINAWATNGFQLNWIAIATTNRRYIAMAIKGGQWAVGESTIDVDTVNNTSMVSGLAFQPIGFSLVSESRTESTAGTSSTTGMLTNGCASSTTSRRALGMLDENATASSVCEVDLAIEYDGAMVRPSNAGALTWVIDVNAVNSDGFQLIVDSAVSGEGVIWYGYLAFASAAAGLSIPVAMHEYRRLRS